MTSLRINSHELGYEEGLSIDDPIVVCDFSRIFISLDIDHTMPDYILPLRISSPFSHYLWLGIIYQLPKELSSTLDTLYSSRLRQLARVCLRETRSGFSYLNVLRFLAHCLYRDNTYYCECHFNLPLLSKCNMLYSTGSRQIFPLVFISILLLI